jgi:hypothetical protein
MTVQQLENQVYSWWNDLSLLFFPLVNITVALSMLMTETTFKMKIVSVIIIMLCSLFLLKWMDNLNTLHLLKQNQKK